MSKYAAMSDHQLVELYEQGVDEVFDVLLNRNQEHLFAYIMRLTQDVDRANDVFQETFMKAIVCIRGRQYRTTGKFSAWLMRIAHNLVIDQFRQERNENVISNDESEIDLFNNSAYSEGTIEARMVNTQVLKDVRRLVNSLPDNQREVIYMRYYQSLSFKDIAAITGVSINTALGRVRYAVMNLRRMAEEKNISLALETV